MFLCFIGYQWFMTSMVFGKGKLFFTDYEFDGEIESFDLNVHEIIDKNDPAEATFEILKVVLGLLILFPVFVCMLVGILWPVSLLTIGIFLLVMYLQHRNK